jgi:TonB family protein
MMLSILLLCSSLLFGQDTSPASKPRTEPPDQKSQNQNFGLGSGIQGKQLGALDILSDTQGVDFGSYLQRILQDVRQNWYLRIPESATMKKGKLAIEFAITKDGKVPDMRLVATSGDAALDRAAWLSITASNPFPPLPSEFKGQYLALRSRFYYNPDKNDFPLSASNFGGFSYNPVKNYMDCPSTSAVTVCINAPADLEVPAGGSIDRLIATVRGTKEQAVDWIVKCSGSACGKMTSDMYIAPIVRPNPPVVTLTAVSKADPTAKASVTVHIVRPAPPVPTKP